MPSIFCYKETVPDSWTEHFCLVKPNAIFDDEDSASEAAENDLANACSLQASGGSVQDFALSLRYKGYKSVSDFRVIRNSKRL